MDFRQFNDLFSAARTKNAIPPELSFEDFARMGAQATGDPTMAQIAQASRMGNMLRRGNASVNAFVESTPIDDWLASAGGSLAEMVGAQRATGEQVGRSVPRMVVDAAPMIAGGLLGGPPGAAAGRAASIGLAASGGLSALNAYGETGSVGQAAIAGAMPWGASKLYGLGSNAALRLAQRSPWMQRLGFQGGTKIPGMYTATDLLGGDVPLGIKLAGRMLERPMDKALAYFGGQGAIQAGTTGLDVLQHGPGVLGSRDYWFANLAGNIPFLALDINDLRGKRWIGKPDVIYPPAPDPTYTPAEARAKAFSEMMAQLNSDVLRTAQRRSSGLDIAEAVLTERKSADLQSAAAVKKATALDSLRSTWQEYSTTFPGTPPLESALTDRSVLEDYPGAKEMMEKFDKDLKAIEGERNRAMGQVKFSDDTLLGTAIEELKLPETLLAKPVAERTFEDYDAVLGGVLSKEGAMRLFRRHMLDATGNDPAPEFKFLSDVSPSGVKKAFEERLRAVNAELIAKGRKPVTDVEFIKQAKMLVEEGIPLNEAREKVVAKKEKQLNREEGAKEVKRVMPKSPGRPKGQTPDKAAKVAAIKKLVEEATLAGEPTEEQKFLAAAGEHVGEHGQNNPELMDRMYSFLANRWKDTNMPLAERFATFVKGVRTVVSQNNPNKIKTVPLNEEITPNAPEIDEGVYADENVGEMEEDVDADGLADEALALVEPEEHQLDQEVKDRVSVRNRMVELMRKRPGMDAASDEQLLRKIADMPEDKRREFTQRVMNELGVKFASGGQGDFRTGFQKLLPLPDYANKILEDLGYDQTSRAVMVPQLVEMVKMFESPEVRYGDLTNETPGMKFARTSAGGGFLFGMAEFNPQTRKLLRANGRDATVGRDGTLSELEFRQAGGEEGPLKPEEVEFYKQLVPEAFEGGRVKVDVLWDGLKKAGESVKVVTYGQANESNTTAESLARSQLRDQASHMLETLGYKLDEDNLWIKNGKDVFDVDEPDAVNWANIFYDNEETSSPGDGLKPYEATGPRATSYYNSISPFDTKQFPVQRVDVVLPIGKLTGNETSAQLNAAGDARKPLWRPDNLHENLPNTLGWAMVQIIPHPVTGEKVMFIGELQSRWAQSQQRGRKEFIEEGLLRGRTKEQLSKEYDKSPTFADHPLLPIHQSLILKSVIREAQRQGIDKIAISDGETAMMTEMHDQHARQEWNGLTREDAEYIEPQNGHGSRLKFSKDPQGRLWKTVTEANKVGLSEGWVKPDRQIIEQEGGMRLAYDTTLPSLMKKLVGEGQLEEFGVHKNAQKKETFDDFRQREALQGPDENGQRMKTVGSPIFRDPSGSPKTLATARTYDISNPSTRVSSLFARNNQTTYAAALDKLRQIYLNPAALKVIGKDGIPRVLASLTAHENSHILVKKAEEGVFGPEAKRLVDEFKGWATTASQQDVRDLVDTLAEVNLSKELRDLPGVKDVLANLGTGKVDADEVIANALGAFASGKWEKSAAETMTLLPGPVRRVFDWIAGKMQDLWKGMQTWAKLGFSPTKIGKARDVQRIFDSVRKGARSAEENLGEMAALASLTPGDVVGMKFARGRFGASGKPQAELERMMDNWVMKGADFVENYPALIEPFTAMADSPAMINDRIMEALSPIYGPRTIKGGQKVQDGAWTRIRKSESLSKLTQSITVHVNERMIGEAVTKDNPDGTVSFDSTKLTPELRGRLDQFSPEAQQAVAEYFVRRQKTMQSVQETVVNAEKGRVVANLGRVINRLHGMQGRFGEGKKIAEGMMAAIGSGDQVALAEAMKALPPDEAPPILRLAGEYHKLTSELERFYQGRPNFASFRLFRPIKQYFEKGGKKELLDFDTAAQAESKTAEMEKDGWTLGRTILKNNKGKEDQYTLDPEIRKMIFAREEEIGKLYDALPIDEDVRRELRQELDIGNRVEIAQAAKSIYAPGTQRKITDGAERLDPLDQDLFYVNAAVRQAMMKELESKISAQLDHPDLLNYPEAKNTFKQMFENFRNPTPGFLQKISKANAAWFLGFNLPGHFAELMQPVMTHLPELRARGMGAMGGLRMIQKAQKEIMEFYVKSFKDKKLKGKDVNLWDYWNDPQEKDMLQKLIPLIEQGPLQTVFEEVGFKQNQLAEMFGNGKAKSVAELIATPANMLGNAGLKLYSKFTQHNTISALLTGYRAARKQGMNHEEAIESTKQFERVVNKTGGKASRQAGPFEGKGYLGHLFYALQGYTTGWLGQLTRYYRHGFKSGDYPQLKPAQIENARKAFRQMLVSQVGMAGIMGMPFFAAGLALMEDLTGEDLRGKLYQAVDEATGDPLIANAATHGIASAVAEGLGLPADLHSRFALGGFLGLNSYDGFSASSLMGPVASMINSMWNMGSKFTQEKDLRAALAEGGPTAVKNLAKALGPELPSSSPDGSASTLDTLFAGLGFRSSEERKQKELQRVAAKLSESDRRMLALGAQRVRVALLQGPQVAGQVLQTEVNKLLAGAARTPQLVQETTRQLANKVASLIASETLPQDYRQGANERVEGRLDQTAQAMGVTPQQGLPLQRELLRMKVLAMMGLPYGGSVRRAAASEMF